MSTGRRNDADLTFKLLDLINRDTYAYTDSLIVST